MNQSIPAPFDDIIARLLEERPEPLAYEPVRAVIPLRRISRPFSELLHFEVDRGDDRWRGYIKIGKPTLAVDFDAADSHDRMRKDFREEYNVLLALRNVFASEPEMSTPRPVALYEDYPAMITEDTLGRDLLSELKARAGFVARPGGTEWLETACGWAGRWLARFQSATADRHFGRYSLDDMREYIDRRLRILVKHRAWGFDSELRANVLRHFDTLAAEVSMNELDIAGVHGDFSIQNVLRSDAGIVVLDFSTYAPGSLLHDVVYFRYKLAVLAIHPMFTKRLIDRLIVAFSESYDPQLDVHRALYHMFQLQHRLCLLTGHALRKRESIWARIYAPYLARHEFRRLVQDCLHHPNVFSCS